MKVCCANIRGNWLQGKLIGVAIIGKFMDFGSFIKFGS